MDKGVETTQKIVIISAVVLGLIIIFTIGYSLIVKSKRAENELANKIALDSVTKKKTSNADVSLTGESKSTSGFTYDGLVQKKAEEVATTTSFEIVNEQVPVEVPSEIPKEVEEEVAVEPIPAKPPTKRLPPVDEDQPLTEAEILRIRQLPVDQSPSGNLQTALEEESQGQYKARY